MAIERTRLQIRDVTFDGLAAIELVHAGIRMIVIHEVGPRIAWFGPLRGDNLLFWDAADERRRGGFHLRGGHRVWATRPVADETAEAHLLDDGPCRIRRLRDGVAIAAPPDVDHLVKVMVVRARPGGFMIDHLVTNAGDLMWTGGVWALTCTQPRRGVTYGVPLGDDGAWDVFALVIPRRWGGHTSPVADPQITLTDDCLVLRPRGHETKRMIQAPRGLIGMTDAGAGLSFVKHAAYDRSAVYPYGTNLALYAGPDSYMVAMETLGPIREVLPGETIDHGEAWTLARPIDWRAWQPHAPVPPGPRPSHLHR